MADKKVNLRIVEAYLDETPEEETAHKAAESQSKSDTAENDRMIQESMNRLDRMLDRADKTIADGIANRLVIDEIHDAANAASAKRERER